MIEDVIMEGAEFDRGDLARALEASSLKTADIPTMDEDEARETIDALFGLIGKALKEHGRVEIHSVGVFERVRVEGRSYWIDHDNDGTISEYFAPAHYTVKFRPSTFFEKITA